MSDAALTGLIFFGTAALIVAVITWALVRARARRRAELSGPELESPELRGWEAEALGESGAVPALEAEEAEVPAEPAPAPVAPAARDDAALRAGLAKTHASLWGKLSSILGGGAALDGKIFDQLEEALLTADVGVKLTMRLMDDLRAAQESGKLDDAEAVRAMLERQITAALLEGAANDDPLVAPAAQKPRIILFVGVNGAGKTTTIGKIAAQLRDQNQNVVLAAGDTFRAAAAEQLGIWAERTGASMIRGAEGADPASVVFNAVAHAKQVDADVVLCDTAGRLHTKKELMDEIQKVKRAAAKAREGAPDETWLVVDGTTGQNALQQAREFHGALTLSGVILTKLDGTAKGGIVVAIADELKVPVRFVGVGEKAEDLRPFDAGVFAHALFERG